MALDLARVEKGEIIPDNMAPTGTKLEDKGGGIASRWFSSLPSWIADRYFKQVRSFLRNLTKIKQKYEFKDQL